MCASEIGALRLRQGLDSRKEGEGRLGTTTITLVGSSCPIYRNDGEPTTIVVLVVEGRGELRLRASDKGLLKLRAPTSVGVWLR